MTIDEYVKKWCEEDYDVRKEDFYVENAYYTADKEWAISGFKHGLFAFLVAGLTVFLGGGDFFQNILNAVVNMGILTVCFWFYGIRNYDANCLGTSLTIYIMIGVLMLITRNKVSALIEVMFAISTFVLWVYLTFVKPIGFIKVALRMKKLIEEDEREEEDASKESYSRWESGYKAFRYGLPEPEQPMSNEDPIMVEARKLFEGYKENKQVLKARYRQLAKQHHPDKGGDTKMFQCIIAVYEEINITLVA